MNEECGLQEGDLVGHLVDLLDLYAPEIDDCVDSLIYVLADVLAQATDYETDSDNLHTVLKEFTACYALVCANGNEQTTISIQ